MGNTFHLGPTIVNVDLLSWERETSSIVIACALICGMGESNPMYQHFIQEQERGFMQRG